MDLNPPFLLVQDQAALQKLIAALDQADHCALDTEADSMHHYRGKLCLIQITLGKQNYIVDPIAKLDVAPLWKAKAVQNMVLHGADYDLRMLHNTFGFSPLSIFDTMIAAKFLGEPRIGLTHLVERRFGIQLSKANQKADWTIRPLPDDMTQYAVLDTYFLDEIQAWLTERLVQEGKLEWVQETCQQLIAQTSRPPEISDDEEEPWRIRGSNKLYPNELVFLRALHAWREKEAEKLDRPPFKVLNPDFMLDIAMDCARSPQQIDMHSLPRLPRNFTGERLESFLRTLQEAAQLPEDQWPEPEKRKRVRIVSPDSSKLEKFRVIRDELAAKHNIDPTLLANRNALIALAQPGTPQERRSKAHSMDWQWKLLAPALGLE